MPTKGKGRINLELDNKVFIKKIVKTMNYKTKICPYLLFI